MFQIKKEESNLRSVVILCDGFGGSPVNTRILPERFNSSSTPSSVPIVLPELNSVSGVNFRQPDKENV
jgi:mannose/fructose-specific phosphotransferase system component IIA